MEQYDAIWDDGVAPEVTLDFDCQHISSGEGLVSGRIIYLFIVFLFSISTFVINIFLLLSAGMVVGRFVLLLRISTGG